MLPTNETQTRLQRAAAGIGLSVVSCAILLGAAELGLRLYDRVAGAVPLSLPDPARDLYVAHPYLPVVLKPSTDYRDADTAGHINAMGMRGPERTVRKPAGVVRILCVGGSTTFGAGIVGDENTWPARLEERLGTARPGRRIEVLNAGVPGYTTAENVILLSLRLLDNEPDVVVLYEGYNDFKPNRHPGFTADYAHWRDRESPPARPWGEESRLVSRMRTALFALRPQAAARPARDARTGAALPRYDDVSEEGVAAFARNLRTMIATSRAAGARVVLLTYPHPCTNDNLARHPGQFSYLPGFLPGLTFRGVQQAFDRYNEEVRRVARNAGSPDVVLVDSARMIPADATLFVDHVHFNGAGAARFADAIVPGIAALIP